MGLQRGLAIPPIAALDRQSRTSHACEADVPHAHDSAHSLSHPLTFPPTHLPPPPTYSPAAPPGNNCLQSLSTHFPAHPLSLPPTLPPTRSSPAPSPPPLTFSSPVAP
jgi:hypothetical protein